LLPGGKAAPISRLKPGDTVIATSTKTGKTTPEIITAVEVNHDTDLYDLKVKTSHSTQVIHTTASHLFWDPSLNYWVPANHLKKGEKLKTPDGRAAVVVGGSVPVDHDGWMWDLTVPGDNDHDFYVAVAATAVLVHNCPEGEQIGVCQLNGSVAVPVVTVSALIRAGCGGGGIRSLPGRTCPV
jgi:hypothetical protein